MGSEKNFENRIKTFLKKEGCWLIKYWGGAMYTKSGIPDILICCNGSFLGIEVKARDGRPSDLQIYNLRKIDEAGGFAILLYPDDYISFQDLIWALKAGAEKLANYQYKILKKKWEEIDDKRRTD